MPTLRRSLRLLFVLGCGLLAACTAARPLPPEKAAGYERIGILSAMGDDLEICNVRITPIRSCFRIAIDFGADEIITRRLEQALSQKYEVIDLSQYRQAVLKTPTPYPSEIPLPSTNEPFIPNTVQKLMGDRAPQAYVVITPTHAGIRDADMAVEGIGVIRVEKDWEGHGIEQFYAVYRIRVIDAAEAKVVADMKALLIGRKPPTSSALERLIKGDPEPESVINAPNTPIALRVWGQPGKHTERLKKSLEEVIGRSLPETLRHVGLID